MNLATSSKLRKIILDSLFIENEGIGKIEKYLDSLEIGKRFTIQTIVKELNIKLNKSEMIIASKMISKDKRFSKETSPGRRNVYCKIK
jgi:hypothetical protein